MGDCWILVRRFVSLLLCTTVFAASTINGLPTSSLSGAGNLYRGKYIGRLLKREHKVSGEVYAVDARTIHIRGFSYDGAGPDAFFWTGFTDHPSPQGIIIPNEKGTKEVLGAYTNQDITLTLPDGLTLRDIKWLAVWCRAFEVNFGDVYIAENLDYPQPHVIGSLSGQHDVASGPIVVVDAQTILLPDFTYDGQAPDVHFWVGRGKPAPEGMRVPDETGSDVPLVKANKKTMVLSLPGDLTIFDIDYFGIWCRLYYVDFGHVRVPKNLNVPPSLKMLGVTPQTKLNCEVLQDDLALEVRWAVAGESIVMQLVGRIDENDYMAFGLSGDDSRSIMIGGDVVVGWHDKNTGRGHVADYYLDSKSQCSGRRGTCPDSKLQAGSNNVRLLSGAVVNGFTMLTFQRPLKAHDELDRSILTNGSQPVIWAVGPINQRQEASYHKLWNKEDLFIEFGRVPKWNCPAPEEPTSVTPSPLPTSVHGLASLQNEPEVTKQPDYSKSSPAQQQYPAAQKHSNTVYTKESSSKTNAAVGSTQLLSTSSSNKFPAWRVPPILCHEPEDYVFYAQMGPTGGKRGYSAITEREKLVEEILWNCHITANIHLHASMDALLSGPQGQVGWGISWYINGLLVPELYVVRGKTYTFVVEGGNDPEVPAKYHPFYITDDPEGGYQHKSPDEKKAVRVFAGHGVDAKGDYGPTATGRLCRWAEGEQSADSFASYGAYQRSLSLHCDDGHPGILHWTPDENTPDLVYYQCYTHRFLGWKIHVLNSCDAGSDSLVDASDISPSRLGAPVADQEVEESIQEKTSVIHPNNNNLKMLAMMENIGIPMLPSLSHPNHPAFSKLFPSDILLMSSSAPAMNSRTAPETGNPIDSVEARVQSVADASNGKTKLPEHKTSPDKSQLSEKQEHHQVQGRPFTGSAASPQVLPGAATTDTNSAFRRPLAPVGVPYGQNTYLQVTPVAAAGNIAGARPAIHPGPQYAPIQYSQDGRPIGNSGQPHTAYIPYSDPYGQRVIDSSGVIYEARPGLDYFLGPTGRPGMGMGHPIHYDGVPPAGPIIYASTPLPMMTTSRYDPPGGIGNSGAQTGTAIPAAVGTAAPASATLTGKPKDTPAAIPAGPLIRIPQQTSAPVLGLNPADSIKFMDYVSPANYRINTDVRGRAHTRNLPKRDQVRTLHREAEDFKLGLSGIGAEMIGDDSPFEIMKINDTDSLPFNLAREVAEVFRSANKGVTKTTKFNERNPTTRQQQQTQESGSQSRSDVGEIRIPVQVFVADEGTMPNFQEPTTAVRTEEKRSGPRGPQILGNYMNKKFKEDRELDTIGRSEDKEVEGAQRYINRETALRHKMKTRRTDDIIGSDAKLENQRQKGQTPLLQVTQGNSTDDTTRTTTSSTGHERYNGFKQPEMTSLEPLFRPSAQDSFFRDNVASSMMMMQQPQHHTRNHQDLSSTRLAYLHGLKATSGSSRKLVNEASFPRAHPFYLYHQKPALDAITEPKTGSSRRPVPLGKDLIVAANDRLEILYSAPSRAHNNHAGGLDTGRSAANPMAAPIHPGAVLTYDGATIDLNNGGVSIQPNADVRTPAILHKPQFVAFRGEFPPPVPEIVPANLPQLASSRRSLFQQARAPQQSNDMISMSSNQNVRHLLPLQRFRPQPGRRLSGKPEMIPTDDVKIVLVKGTDEKLTQQGRETPKTPLHRETRPDRVPLKHHPISEQKPSSSFVPSSTVVSALKGKVPSPPSHKTTEHGTQAQPSSESSRQNNTDLHILTDIWSIINQDDATRTQSRLELERSQRHAPENAKAPIRPVISSVVAHNHEKGHPQLSGFAKQPLLIFSHPYRRNRRSPDHIPGHSGSDDDHHHDHDHSTNSGISLVGHLSLISTGLLILWNVL